MKWFIFLLTAATASAAHRDLPGCLNSINYSDSVKLARGDFVTVPKKGAFLCEETECCCWDGFDPEITDVEKDQFNHCALTLNIQKRADRVARKSAAAAVESIKKSRLDEIHVKLKNQDLSPAEQNEMLRLERGL